MAKPLSYHYSFLALSQIMVGLGIVCSKYLLLHLPLFIILELRFAIAAAVLHILGKLIYRRHHIYPAKIRLRDWLVITAKACCAGFLFNVFMLLGLHYTHANVAGIITSALPAVVALMSFFLLKEKLSLSQWFCIIFAVAGIAAINTSSLANAANAHSLLGDFFIILSLFPEAAYYILAKRFHTRLPVISLAALINVINALLFLPFTFFVIFQQDSFHLNVSMIGIIIINSITSGLFYVFWYMGSKNIPVSTASLFTAVMPISTIIIAWVFLEENLHLAQFIGMLLIIGSIAIGTRRPKVN